MEIEIKEEKDNPFLKRKELRLEIKHVGEATPSKQAVIKEIASKYSVPEDHIEINYIFTKKGVSESVVKAKIYEEPIAKPKEEKTEEKKEGPKEEKKEVKNETQASEAK